MGFGRWGKDGVVTHTTTDGRLTPVKSKETPTSQTPTTTQKQEKPTEPSTAGKTETVPFEEFERTLPKFTEEDETIADEDEESGNNSIYGSDNWEEVVDTVEKWKWGGDEGKGAWGFDAEERTKIFDTVNKHIRDTKATVKAPRLHRGIAFESSDAAQRFISQFTPGQSVDLPPCGWAPNSETALGYGPRDPSQPEISAMIELEAGDNPISGLSTTSIERNMGMEVIQREVITPGDMKYEVREVKPHTVTENGKTKTIYKIVLRQAGYTNENVNAKAKKYSILAFMGGNMAMPKNLIKNYKKYNKK